MPFYHVGFSNRAGINTANSPIVNLWSATRLCRIHEVAVFIQVAQTTAPVFALARASARGTQTATLAPIRKDETDIAATATLDTTWSANPTFSNAAPHIRAGGVPLAIGNGIIWNLDELEVSIGQGLCLFNINASGATLGSYAGYIFYQE
jgi:hypothetical protein